MDGTGAISGVVGEGFTVVADSVTAGAFQIYFDADKVPVQVWEAKVNAYIAKATAAAASDYAADISSINLSAARPYVTGRGYTVSTLAVAAPAVSAVFSFEISGVLSTVGIY